MRSFLLLLVFITGVAGCYMLPRQADSAAPSQERPAFTLFYTAWIKPDPGIATVKLRISSHPDWVNWMRFYVDPERHENFLHSGELVREGDELLWTPPDDDAWIQYDVKIESRRSNGRYDGYITEDWALFRADDLVPPVRTDFRDGTQSRAKLEVHLPDGWSIATRYPRYTSGRYKVDDPDRLIDRPTGWLVMGRIGTRRETIGGTKVTVAAPVDQGVKRMDMIAFLRWTLPTMQSLFPDFPDRLLIVSADDPMWRGALSAPNSLYLHADRPMISGNGTSTLIHELVHVAMSARSGPKADWIVEGLAEYYSLEVLHRSGTLSTERYENAHEELAEWGKDVESLDVERSHGPITAKAVGRLRAIDAEIRERSRGRHSLDDVVRELATIDGDITVEGFEQLVDQMMD
ncbi:hypothetical protein [Abyssibacter profundi]|uniref:Peptidase M61 catalytic domain-containing protein n=1 Tax=Abyssibacter profundi TaxID=2182787 RepID=A0A363UMK3_9GAMM|nr:hypothetical protein [Abyssibacter profundi]PWN56665.1 hypothetical protein DEH80_07595 [Abyssibacter profundi]